MQGHAYAASFSNVSVSAIQDLFELAAAAGVPFLITSIRVGQSSDAGDAEAEMLPIQVSRVEATVTSGSGGSTATPRPLSPASPAASTTVEINNTTQATSTGSITQWVDDTWNVQAGWLYMPTPEEYILVPGGETAVVELPAAPGDAITMYGTITFVEIK